MPVRLSASWTEFLTSFLSGPQLTETAELFKTLSKHNLPTFDLTVFGYNISAQLRALQDDLVRVTQISTQIDAQRTQCENLRFLLEAYLAENFSPEGIEIRQDLLDYVIVLDMIKERLGLINVTQTLQDEINSHLFMQSIVQKVGSRAKNYSEASNFVGSQFVQIEAQLSSTSFVRGTKQKLVITFQTDISMALKDTFVQVEKKMNSGTYLREYPEVKQISPTSFETYIFLGTLDEALGDSLVRVAVRNDYVALKYTLI